MVQLSTTEIRPRDETRRTGAGTRDNPLTDIQVQDLAEQGITEGGIVPGKGRLTPTGTFEPTTITDATIRDKVIPDINKRVDALSETGQYYDEQGNLRESTGEISDDNLDPREEQYNQLLDEVESDEDSVKKDLARLARDTDRQTRRMIQAVQSQYEVRESQLEDINMRNEAATDTALLLGGSSRYSLSASGISAAQERAGIMALAELDAEEQALIAEIKTSQEDKNFERTEKLLDRAEEKRKEKIEQARKLAESLAETNEKLREKQMQASREMSIASLFTQGVSDPSDIQGMLSELGESVSLKDIQSTLEIINPSANLTGLTADYKTYRALKESGEIPDSWNYLDFQTASANATRKPSTGGNSVKNVFDLAPEDIRELGGVGFSATDVTDIEKIVNDFGIEAALEVAETDDQKKAIERIFDVPQKVTREQIETQTTQKQAQDGLKKAYTEQELIKLARNEGYARWLKGEKGEIDEFLNSEDAKQMYVDLLADQYRASGMFAE